MSSLPRRGRSELADFTNDELLDYFMEHARYFERNPENARYSIPYGASHLFAADTAALRDKFFRKVRSYRKSET